MNSDLSTSLHYYMSSAYHPDYLTESLPRHKLTISTESDSTGINEPYNDNDISDILDGSFERSSVCTTAKTANEAYIDNIKPMPIIQRPYLKTFVSPSAVEKEDSFESESISGSDSSRLQSSSHGLREYSEIVFDAGTIPLDDKNDGFCVRNECRLETNKTGGKVSSTIRADSLRPFQNLASDSPRDHKVTYMEHIRARTKSPIYDNLGVVETSTSFSKLSNDASSVQNSLASTGSFTVSHINSSQSDTESLTLTPRTSKTSACDSVNNGDDEMNDSSGRNSSVILL